jgi:4-amino-4-deoxy-L-arabinose transferase-like glycosyltransferase
MRPSILAARVPDLHSTRVDLLFLFGLGVLVLGAGLGLRDPWPADEPRFALIAKEMVQSGQWFFPTRGGELYADKPPVFMWLQAIFYALTGSTRISFLLPNLLAGLATLGLVYDLGRRLWDRHTALSAGLLLLFTFQFTLQARSGQIDGLVSFWICLSVYGMLRHMLLGPAWGWYWLGCFAAGLGVITKGVGIIALLLLIPYFAARHWRWRWRGLAAIEASAMRWLAGIFFLLLAIGLWFVPMLLQVAASDDPALAAYRDNIVFRQTVDRYASAWHHLKPFWFYLVQVIPFFWLPVSVLLPWLIPAWRRALQNRDARILLPLGWIALVILFFSLSPGKRGVYLTPAVPMLALISAPYLGGLLQQKKVQWTLYATTAVLVLGFAAFYLAHLVSPSLNATIEAEHQLDPWPLVLTIAALGVLLLLLLRPRQGALSFVAFFLVFWFSIGFIAYPQFTDVRSSRDVLAKVNALVPAEHELGMLGWKEQTLLQADRPVALFGREAPAEEQARRAAAWLRARPDRHLLLTGGFDTHCFDLTKSLFIARRHRSDWYLADSSALTGRCITLTDTPSDTLSDTLSDNPSHSSQDTRQP